MPKTRRGVYHNLNESKYAISNTEIAFFFSSEYLMNKFLDNYESHRITFNDKIDKLMDTTLNMDMLADIKLYETTEKRGFKVSLKGANMNWQETNQYALRKMTEKNSLDWSRIPNPKSIVLGRNMV